MAPRPKRCDAMVDGCRFCGYIERERSLIVAEETPWVLGHVDRRWPLGSLYLVYRHHALVSDISGEDWRAAAPLMALASRLVRDAGGAERVYMLSFTEGERPHFHLLFFCKTRELAERYDGAKALSLAGQVDEPMDKEAALEIVQRYRWAAEPREP